MTSFNLELASLLDDMKETMYKSDGVGLAAPQIGVLKRVTVIDVSKERDQLMEFINPEILGVFGKTTSEEGCLSIPGFRDSIKRSRKVLVKAQDRTGKEFTVEADELLAICLQHEIDHLDGVLFIDHLSRLKLQYFKRWLEKQLLETTE